MARPYKKLRDLLHEAEITLEDLAAELLIGKDTASRKLNCHSEWTCDQMWKIMDLLGQPEHKLHEIFPRNGINEPGVKRSGYRIRINRAV